VSAVGFVDNPTNCYSRLQTLTIEEYYSKRLAYVVSHQDTVNGAHVIPVTVAAAAGT